MDADRVETAPSRGHPRSSRGVGTTAAPVPASTNRSAPKRARKPEQFLEVGERKLVVRRSGTGPPILLLPGIGMPSDAWIPLLRHLHGFECIAVAMPGSGGLVTQRPVWTMSGFAELARGVLDALDIPKADVLGLSFGGLVAQQLAYDAPTRVRGLVLVSTSCGLGGISNNPVNWWSAMLSDVWPTSGAQGACRGHWGLMRELSTMWSTRPRLDGLAEQIAAATLWSSLSWLPRLSHRALVITGTADPLVPAANASILASGIPRAQLHRVRGGGHMCLLDRAAEVAPTITSFLRSLEQTPTYKVAESG